MGRLDVHIRHGGGDGGPAAAVVVLLLFIAVGLRSVWPEIVHAVEIAAWTVAAIIGTTITVTLTVLTVRVVRRHRARRAIRQVTYRAEPVIPPARLAARPVGPPAARPALDRPRQGPARSWPLPGWWEEIRPRIGGDSDEHRPR
jgi:hypothetical protein